jgi:DNA-binding NarL/FixJ family response regulator
VALTCIALADAGEGRSAAALEEIERVLGQMDIDRDAPIDVVLYHTKHAMILAAAGSQEAANRALAAASPLVRQADAMDALVMWLQAAGLVLADGHSQEAARALGAVEQAEADSRSTSERLRALAETRIVERCGRVALERELRVGRVGDPWRLFRVLSSIVQADLPAGSISAAAPYGRLTGRERAVLELLASGSSDAEIGARLGISAKTASVHVTNVKAKLGVASRVQAGLVAQQVVGNSSHAMR